MPAHRRVFRRRRPRDIAIVGIDGAGKTTLARSLQTELGKQGFKTAVLDVPHFLDFGRGIKRVSGVGKAVSLKGAQKKSKKLFTAGSIFFTLPTIAARARSRKSNIRVIERHPVIEAPVLASKYSGKAIVAFSKIGGRTLGGPLPDIAIFLSVKPEIAMERTEEERRAGGPWAEVQFQHKTPAELTELNNAYRSRMAELASKGVWVYEVDASLPKEEVLGQVRRLVEERKLLDRSRKKYFERKKEEALNFTLEGIERWEKEGKIPKEKAEELRGKLGRGYFSDFLTNFGIHLAISGIPVVMAGVGSIGRPTYTAAARTKGVIKRLAGRIPAEEYEKIKRLHSGEAMLIGAIPFAGRVAYIASSIIREPELMGILADHFAYRKLGGLHKRYRVQWAIEKITRGARRYLEVKISIEKKAKEKIRRKKH